MLPEVEKTWVLLENDYIDIKNRDGKVLYRMKECVDDFVYTYTDGNGRRKSIKLREKRVVTYNPKLAEKQNYEINKQVEKAKALRVKSSGRLRYCCKDAFSSLFISGKCIF